MVCEGWLSTWSHRGAQPIRAQPGVGAASTLTDYFSGFGRLRVRPHTFTSTLLLPPLHNQDESTAPRTQGGGMNKRKCMARAMEVDQMFQQTRLKKLMKSRRAADATEPVVRQRLDLLFEHLGDWAPILPGQGARDAAMDPGLLFQLDAQSAIATTAARPQNGVQILKFDEQEQQILLTLMKQANAASRSPGPAPKLTSAGEEMLRPVFCRFLLDLNVCDQSTIYYHWAVNVFDAHASTHKDTPHRFVTPLAFEQVLGIILGRRFTRSEERV